MQSHVDLRVDLRVDSARGFRGEFTIVNHLGHLGYLGYPLSIARNTTLTI